MIREIVKGFAYSLVVAAVGGVCLLILATVLPAPWSQFFGILSITAGFYQAITSPLGYLAAQPANALVWGVDLVGAALIAVAFIALLYYLTT